MTNNEAREYFISKGLDYRRITALDIEELYDILSEELKIYLNEGGGHAQQMAMRVKKQRVKDKKFLYGRLQYAFIKIDGSYFHAREGISFNKGGFIGFGGEFSTTNTAPILKAFCKWCDNLTN